MQCGMLQQMVLRELSERALSGYDICTRIEKKIGKRPSYGSIYPLLEKLSKEKHVSTKAIGRKKIYTLTKKGECMFEEMHQEHENLITNEMVRIKKVMGILEVDPGPMLSILERARKGEAPLGPVTAQMFRFRDQIFRMVQDGRVEKNAKQINAIITIAIKELEQIR